MTAISGNAATSRFGTLLRPGAFATMLAAALALLLIAGASWRLAGAPQAAGGELQPGQLAGDFSTDSRGGAVYSLPLAVPPGTAGLQPSLSLLYQSHAQDGIVGMGWNLFGVSAIERCVPPFLEEGKVGGIRYDKDASFCLDGVLLVKVGDTAEGAVYHTEKESWTRIIASGQAGSGPATFRARTKEGIEIDFGGTPDSRILAVGRSDVRVWASNRITDRNGNFLELGYLNNPENTGAFYPTEIRYTGHADLAPQRRVELAYESRPDRPRRFLAGTPVYLNRRLSSVRTLLLQDGAMRPVESLRLEYGQSPATGRSRLLRITQLDAADNRHPPSIFDWQDGALSLDAPRFLTDFGDQYACTWGDFNGDGRSDLLCDHKIAPFDHYVLLSLGNGLGKPIPLGTFGSADTLFTWADFNGDGRADLLADQKAPGSQHWALLSTGEKLAPPLVLPGFAKAGGEFTWSDFDGDGRADLICGLTAGDHSQWVLRSTGNSLAPAIALGPMGQETGSYRWHDFNGDGKQDLIFDEPAAPYRHWVRLSTGRDLAPRTDLGTLACEGGAFQWADWNGDRLIDLLCDERDPAGGSSRHRVRPSNGRTLEAARELGVAGGKNASFQWLDFNADGMADLLVTEPQGGGAVKTYSLGVSLSTGEGLQNALSLGDFQAAEGSFSWADLNGDSLPDLVFNRSAGKADLQVRLHAGQLPDLATGFTNGLGGKVTASYRPLTDERIYTSTGTGYPLSNLASGLYVVAEHSTNDGRENPQTYFFGFHYEGSKRDNGGRGWLGFSRITATDRQTGTRKDTGYRLDYPFTGVTGSTEAAANSGLKLSRSEYAYTSTQPYPGVWQVLRTREKLIQYGKSTKSYALERELSYDAYGNAVFLWDRGDPTDPLAGVYRCTRYLNDPGLWRLGFPSEEIATDKAAVGSDGQCVVEGKKLGWSQTGYSGGPRMNLAYRQQWVDTDGSWLRTSYEYDAYGNVTAVDDPVTSRTVALYDETYHTFPVEARNALGQRQTVRFDPRFGAQVESSNLNGYRLETRLDGFGQPAESWGPAPSGAQVRLTRYRRHFTRPQSGELFLETRQRPRWNAEDEALWPWERELRDGLNRTYRTSQGAPDAAHPVVTDRRFNDEAQATGESQPYYEGEPALWNSLAYDEHGRLRSVTLPSQTVTTTDRDVVEHEGRVLNRTIETTDGPAGGKLVTTSYLDARGNLLERVYTAPAGSPQPPTARYRYDRLGRVTEATAPSGTRTEIAYDSVGRQTRIANTDRGPVEFRYLRASGLLGSQTDCLGQQIAYTYDALGRVTTKTLPAGKVVTFEYDQTGGDPWIHNPVGNLVRVTTTRAGTVESRFVYSHDAYDRTTGSRVTLENGRTYSSSTEIGPDGQPATLTSPDASVLEIQRSGLGFLTSLRQRDEAKPYVTYEDYTALGQPRKASFKNGVVTSYSYLPSGLLRQTATGLGSHSYLNQELSWNSLGFVTHIADQLVPARSQAFTYDGRGYLTVAESQGLYGKREYEYDAAGNLRRNGDITYESTRDQVRRGVKNGQEVFKAEYDCLGQRTAQDRDGHHWSYTYDGGQQLVKILRDGESVYDFRYDYLGRRLEKKEAGGTTTYYLLGNYEVTVLPDGSERHTKYIDGPSGHVAAVTRSGAEIQAALAQAARGARGNGWHPPAAAAAAALLAAFLSLLLLPPALWHRARLRVPRGRPRPASTAMARRHPWRAATVPVVIFTLLLNLVPVAPAAAATAAEPGVPQPGTLYFHQNHLQSTSLLTDEQGTAVTRVDYLPYGEVFQLTGPNDFRAKFSGQELDEASGLYDFQTRYYDPRTARFTTADSLLVSGPDQTAAALNLYAYTGNNPLSYTDPSGQDFGISALVAAIVIAVGVTVGAYAGGAAVNHNLNPAQWDWSSPKTALGIVAGAVIGGVGAAIDVAAIATLGPVAGGLLGGAVAGVLEGAAFSALGGGDAQQIAEDALLGGVLGVALTGIGAAAGRAAARVRAPASAAVEGAQEVARAEAGLSRRLVEAADTCLCFPEGTEVATGHGPAAIQDVEPGDEVWAFDETSGRTELRPVTGVYARTADAVVQIAAGGEALETTPAHPVWVEDQGWTEAAAVAPGDHLLDLAGKTVVVEAVAKRAGAFRVFNFTVEKAHTFYASASRVLVHNCGGFFRSLITRARYSSSGPRPGRLGNMATQKLNKDVAVMMEKEGYQVLYGGGTLKEEFLPGPKGGLKGSNYADGTFKGPDGGIVRVQTVDVTPTGLPTAREAAAADNILLKKPNDMLVLISKRNEQAWVWNWGLVKQ